LAVTDLKEAHRLLAPLLGSGVAPVLFAVALLCSGQSSTISGTLAGQIVMEGFVQIRLRPALRRLLTRGLAIVPALIVLALAGEGGVMPLLIASQVVLSLQLPFAIVPLIKLTNSSLIMRERANSIPIRMLAGACALAISVANAALIIRTIAELRQPAPLLAAALTILACAGLGLLCIVCCVPLRSRAAAVSSDAPPPLGTAGFGEEPAH
jgi:manganese transport protein